MLLPHNRQLLQAQACKERHIEERVRLSPWRPSLFKLPNLVNCPGMKAFIGGNAGTATIGTNDTTLAAIYRVEASNGLQDDWYGLLKPIMTSYSLPL